MQSVPHSRKSLDTETDFNETEYLKWAQKRQRELFWSCCSVVLKIHLWIHLYEDTALIDLYDLSWRATANLTVFILKDRFSSLHSGGVMFSLLQSPTVQLPCQRNEMTACAVCAVFRITQLQETIAVQHRQKQNKFFKIYCLVQKLYKIVNYGSCKSPESSS